MFQKFAGSVRALCLLGLAALVGCSVATGAEAQSKYPEKPIRVIVPFAAGGLADVSIRLVTDKLGKNMGQQFVIENMPGAGGIAAANELLKQPADGYNLIVVSNGTAISEALFAKLPYNTVKDMAPVSTVAWFDMMAVTNAKGPFKTLQEFTADAKAKPGAQNIGTINPGSTQNLSAELYKSLAKVDAQIVAFRGTPEVVTSVIRSDVGIGIDAYTALKGQIDSGDLRPLAVTGVTRNPALPNVPTFAEAGVTGYDVTGWNALFVKAGTPADIVARLNKEIAAVVLMDDLKAKYVDLGIVAGSTTPAAIGQRLKDDIAKWADVIEKAGIKKL